MSESTSKIKTIDDLIKLLEQFLTSDEALEDLEEWKSVKEIFDTKEMNREEAIEILADTRSKSSTDSQLYEALGLAIYALLDEERNTGKWECGKKSTLTYESLFEIEDGYYCSECGKFVRTISDYCPHCGSYMRGNEE